ncbi:hypothetical protein AABB24_017435, partial [Solanum stoloniferum]
MPVSSLELLFGVGYFAGNDDESEERYCTVGLFGAAYGDYVTGKRRRNRRVLVVDSGGHLEVVSVVSRRKKEKINGVLGCRSLAEIRGGSRRMNSEIYLKIYNPTLKN